MEINAKKAVELAAKYYEDITGERHKMTVEEIELEEDFWLVTLGIADPFSIAVGDVNKTYKLFRINAYNGEILSMKIREIQLKL